MSGEFADWVDTRMPSHGTSGAEVLSDCPWCGRPKLYVNREKGVFYCQRCRERGRAKKLVAKVEGVPLDEAEGRLRPPPGDSDALLGALASTRSRGAATPTEVVHHPLPPEFVPCFTGAIWQVPEYAERPLPEGRQLSDEAIIRHGVGFCLNGRYRDRLVVPIIQGGQRTFLARLMGHPRDFRWKSKTGEMVEPPKYLAPKNSGLAGMLYWLDHFKEGDEMILVEGVFDAIRLIDLGFAAVATFGKHLSNVQRSMIVKARPRRVVLFRDADATADGWVEALELTRRPSSGVHKMIIHVATCPRDHDPDSLGAEGKASVQSVLDAAIDAGDHNAALLAALKSTRQ